MFRDLFDRLHLAAAIAVVLALVFFLGGVVRTESNVAAPERSLAVERAMLQQARASFLLETYAPVEDMIRAGQFPQALLQLQELARKYPGEPHTSILRGAVLVAQGVTGEGVMHYAGAVKANGDYVDRKSPLNRREEIGRLVEQALPETRAALDAGANPGLERTLRDLYYLQSRMAGGCE